MFSGIALFLSYRAFNKSKGGTGMMAAALALGVTFVGLQGREWVGLLGQGLTLTSSNLGAFFYLIVGMHGLHAVIALALLGWALLKLKAGTLQPAALNVVMTFWFFVVGLWPIIYARVYF